MRKLILAAAAIAAFGFALPFSAATAQAETVVIKSGHRHHHDRGWHRGHTKVVVTTRHHDRGMHRGHRHHVEGAQVRIRAN